MVLSLSYAARVTAHPKPALQPSGRIRGVTLAATADRRERLPRVVLVLTGPALGDNKLSIISDDQGEYSFNRLAAGDYTLAATHAGFERLEQKVTLAIDATVDLDVLLQPSTVQATVMFRPNRIASTPRTRPSPASSRPRSCVMFRW